MRQRAVPCWGLCAHPQPQIGADLEAALASKSGSVLNRKRFAAGLAAGAEIEPPLPAALASRIDLGGIGGWARTGSAPMLDSLHASPYVPASRWHSSM